MRHLYECRQGFHTKCCMASGKQPKAVTAYCRLILKYPYVLIVVELSLCIGCLIATLLIYGLPHFHDPKLGFEVRGSKISNRLRAYELLLKDTVTDISFLINDTAADLLIQHYSNNSVQSTDTDDGLAEEILQEEEAIEEDSYFCDIPRSEYVKIVFESVDETTLFTAEKIHSMCHLENVYFRSHNEFHMACVHTTHRRACCRSWSVGNYVALLANKTSCEDINDEDVESVLKSLYQCAAVFRRNVHIPADCWDTSIQQSRSCSSSAIPTYCRQQYASVYHVLYHLSDAAFLDASPTLQRAITFLPIAAGLGAQSLYEAISIHRRLDDGLTRIIALDFGIKQDVFDEYLVGDMVWFGAALIGVFIAVWLYSSSLFFSICSFVVIFFSVVAAHFLYTVLFNIRFFPFLNLLAIAVLIGIGVDDVFVYLSIWSQAKSDRNLPAPNQLIVNAFSRSTPSAFASSATTAAAFFAGAAASNVPVLCCFGIFAGTAVLCHFIILSLAMPALIIIHNRWFSTCILHCGSFISDDHVVHRCLSALVNHLKVLIAVNIPRLVVKYRVFILLLFSIIGAVALIGIFVYPKLELPSSNEMQLFASGHPFEVYDLKIKPRFWFSRSTSFDVPTMPLTVVWGVKPVSEANRLDPFSDGILEYDSTFDVASMEDRVFLALFCRGLRRTPYYQPESGLQLTNCFIENFDRFMRRDCEGIDGRRLDPCCGGISYSSDVFHTCLHEYVPLITKSIFQFSGNRHAGPRFSKKSGKLVAIIVEFLGNETFSFNYRSVGSFFSYMDKNVSAALSSGPAGLQSGFFISHLTFYDLQRALAYEIPLATCLALAAAAVVSLLITLNVLVTLFAMLTVGLSICVTVAGLACLGWQLNVVESVTISVAVGLSVDFALHHAVAFRAATSYSDRQERVLHVARVVAAPVAMSALTTFIVGALLMPSTVLAYRQLGTFLMIVITVSWAYTTFFFQALLSIAGPKGDCGQLHWTSFGLLLTLCPETAFHKPWPVNWAKEVVYVTTETTETSPKRESSSSDSADSVKEQELEQFNYEMPVNSLSQSPNPN